MDYYCTNCNADLRSQSGFDPNEKYWMCTECGTQLYDIDVDDFNCRFPETVWICDCCGAYLSKQSGFSDYLDSWTCTKCGHINPISESEIYESEAAYQNSINNNSNFDDDSSNYSNFNTEEDIDVLTDENYDDTYDDDEDETYIFDEDDSLYEKPRHCLVCGHLLNGQSNFSDYDPYCQCDRCGCTNQQWNDEDEEETESDYLYGNMGLEEHVPHISYANTRYVNSKHRTSDNYDVSNDYEKIDTKISFREYLRMVFHFIKIIIMVLGILFLVIGIRSVVYEIDTKVNGISIGIEPSEIKGMDKSILMSDLKDRGFLRVTYSGIEDLDFETKNMEDTVESVLVNNDSEFCSNDKYSRFTKIVVRYHAVKRESIPISAADAEGSDYKNVTDMLIQAGFTNISYEQDYDVYFGLFDKQGEIETITIGGDSKFPKGKSERVDAPVRIVYHELAENK